MIIRDAREGTMLTRIRERLRARAQLRDARRAMWSQVDETLGRALPPDYWLSEGRLWRAVDDALGRRDSDPPVSPGRG